MEAGSLVRPPLGVYQVACLATRPLPPVTNGVGVEVGVDCHREVVSLGHNHSLVVGEGGGVPFLEFPGIVVLAKDGKNWPVVEC